MCITHVERQLNVNPQKIAELEDNEHLLLLDGDDLKA